MTANEYAAAIKINVNRLCKASVSFDEFSDENKRLWNAIERDGLTEDVAAIVAPHR